MRWDPTSFGRWQAAATATADFFNDGAVGIAVVSRGDPPELLRNDGGTGNHWLEVLLIGTKSNRDGIGSSLKLTSEGSRPCGAVEG